MLKLLIADDEEDIRKGIRNNVDWEANGIIICGEAEDGDEALGIIKEKNPDILIIDIRMPGTNGLEVLEAIYTSRRSIRSIILSGYDDFTYAQKAIKLGASDYLLKPCRSKDILESVLKIKAKIEAEKERTQSTGQSNGKQIEVNTTVSGTSDTINTVKTGNKVISCALKFIEENFEKDLTLEMVSQKVFVNPKYLSTLFKQVVGENFVDYIQKVRVEKACELLKDISLKTYEVAYKVGYIDDKYFCQIFKKIKGITPGQYRVI